MRLRPPETPRVTGKPGAATYRDEVHSGKRFGIRGKTRQSAIRAELLLSSKIIIFKSF